MSVYLGARGLYTLHKAYSKCKISNIHLAFDAQVVISWLLSDCVKTGNVFARNRIKDVHTMIKELREKYKIPINIKYVPTDQNPGDLLTRGLTYDAFEKHLDFWLHGPLWICSEAVTWPSHELGCLNSNSKRIVTNTCLEEVDRSIEPVCPFNRFSTLTKLLNTTALMIKALHRYFTVDKLLEKWGTTDVNLCTRIHLFKTM